MLIYLSIYSLLFFYRYSVSFVWANFKPSAISYLLMIPTLYYESKSLIDMEKTINKELSKLYLGLNVNRLSLNLDKTHFIIFHPYNKPLKKQITIKINKKAIQEQCFIKYLGVLIDSKLSWKHHVSKISKTISRSLGIMY